MVMKQLIFLLFVGFFLSGYGQMTNWYKSDLSSLGYKHNWISLTKSPKDYSSGLDFTDSSTLNFKGGSTELSANVFSKHAYFHIDGSIFLDYCIVWIQRYIANKKMKDPWYYKPYGDYDQISFLPVRLGFGLPITKYLNVYGGGQYQFSMYRYTPPNNSNYEKLLFGGNQYGFGIHVVGSYRTFLLKYSFMHDWTNRAREFTGKVLTHEATLYFGYKQYGLFAKITFQNHSMDAGNFSESQDKILHSDLAKTTREYRSENMSKMTFSIGLFASGLFSGVSRIASKTVGSAQ
jgi:hypothetical protein